MYKIYIDKPELFEATISIEGASTSNASCRLIMEHSNYSLLFTGTIVNNNIKIAIPQLKSFLKEGLSGNLKLEVTVDDTLFIPWEQSYQTALSKKVTAEVKGSESVSTKPIVEIASVKMPNGNSDNNTKFIKELTTQFKKNKITIFTVKEHIKLIKALTESARKKYTVNDDKITSLVMQALEQAE